MDAHAPSCHRRGAERYLYGCSLPASKYLLPKNHLEGRLRIEPSWLERVPLLGDRAKAVWQEYADDRAKLGQMMKKVIQPASAWLLGAGLAIGRGVVEVALSVFLAFFLFRDGASLTNRLAAAMGRVAGERGRRVLEVAGSTVRGVVYGILGTAIVQGIMALPEREQDCRAGLPRPVSTRSISCIRRC